MVTNSLSEVLRTKILIYKCHLITIQCRHEYRNRSLLANPVCDYSLRNPFQNLKGKFWHTLKNKFCFRTFYVILSLQRGTFKSGNITWLIVLFHLVYTKPKCVIIRRHSHARRLRQFLLKHCHCLPTTFPESKCRFYFCFRRATSCAAIRCDVQARFVCSEQDSNWKSEHLCKSINPLGRWRCQWSVVWPFHNL